MKKFIAVFAVFMVMIAVLCACHNINDEKTEPTEQVSL